MRYAKGHGTENDFVLLPDPDGERDVPAALVAALCDRRAGLGADGLLRVVRASAHPEAAEQAGEAEWFMDYRNGDGSVAEMCGNGLRVFARYLVAEGLAAAGELAVATRGGVKQVHVGRDGEVRIDLGVAATPAELAGLRVAVGESSWDAVGVHMPNPHAVAFLADTVPLEALDLTRAPAVTPDAAFPEGVNVELVRQVGPGHIALRVHERGVGETRSCGTGVAAAAVATRRSLGLGVDDDESRAWVVDVPGGRLAVVERPDGHVELAGPAVVVARGELDPAWLAAASRA